MDLALSKVGERRVSSATVGDITDADCVTSFVTLAVVEEAN